MGELGFGELGLGEHRADPPVVLDGELGGDRPTGKRRRRLTEQVEGSPIGFEDHALGIREQIDDEPNSWSLRACATAPGSGQVQDLPQLVSEGFLSGSVGQLLLDRAGLVRSVSQAAAELFDISALDVGRSFHDLEVSYRPAELRSHLEETLRSRVPVILRGVEWRRGNRPVVFLDIKLTPLFSSAGRPLGVLLSFDDVSRVRRLSDEQHAANRDLETAYEGLQSSNEELETANEELQTTNDELQSTNDILRERTDEVTSLSNSCSPSSAASVPRWWCLIPT